jgi:phage host-nuclease inhibitor protein Gam
MTKQEITSRESLEAAIGECVRLKLRHAMLVAEIEAEKARIEKNNAERVASVVDQIAASEDRIFGYCEANKATLFPIKKSLETRMADVGSEWTPWKVEKPKKRSWAKIVLGMLQIPWAAKYVRKPDPEVNKEALLSDRETLTPDQLGVLGVSFSRHEQWYLRPKPEMAEPSVKEAA